MNPPSKFSSRWAVATVAFAGACLGPMWRMGYLRDDWLLMWSALDPSTAPAGASGVFPRPVAEALWRVATSVGGDAPAAMHAVGFLGWALLLILLALELRAWGASPLATCLAVGFVVSHGALVEVRLWAAASNGVWAVVLALVALGLHRRGGAAHGWAALFWGLAILTRADAGALLAVEALRALRGRSRSMRWRLSLAVALVALALALLTWMLAAGGQWSLRLQDSGRALRLLLVPYGSPLPENLRLLLGVGVALASVVAATWWIRRNSTAAGALALISALLLAQAVVSWSVAGRYLLVPVLLSGAWLALVVRPSGSLRRAAWSVVLVVAAVAVGFGRSARELQATSRLETQLYDAVRERAERPAYQRSSQLRLLDAPAVGWRGEKADLENIVSAALRRVVSVELRSGPGPTLRWTGEQWIEGGAARELP